MQSEFKTWATLKSETPFNHLFPDGRVPIRSPLPIIPREVGSPSCYLVPADKLTDAQIVGLAELLYPQWQPECTSLEHAIAYIRQDALPLQTEWFTGVTSTDFGLLMNMVEMGEELKRSREVDEELDEEWDGNSEYEDEEYYADPVVLYDPEYGSIRDSELIQIVEDVKRQMEGDRTNDPN